MSGLEECPDCGVVMERCAQCEGCGKIASGEDGAPWSRWLELPLRSSLAVLTGLVRPLPCPRCAGEGMLARALPCPRHRGAP